MRDARKAEKAINKAKDLLVDADALMHKPLPYVRQQARKLRKIAKRLGSKAERRIGKLQCERMDEDD